jgi:alpha-N-arabinofuranosidase
VNVVNRHRDQAIQTEFDLEDKHFSGAAEAIEVNGPDIKAENSFDGAPVKPAQRSATAEGKTLHYNFPPHSYTMIRARLA